MIGEVEPRGLVTLAAAWGLTLVACADPLGAVVVVPDLPDEVAWLAVLLEDRAGQPIEGAASGLVRRPSEAGALATIPIELPPDAVRLRLLGYGDEVRDDRAEADEKTLRRHPVHAASARDPVLKGQRYVGAGEVASDPIVVDTEAAATEMTAAWLPPCPAGPELQQIRLDAHCLFKRCVPEIERSDCSLLISGRSCTLDDLAVTLDGRARFHLSTAGTAECTEVEARSARGSTAALSLSCEVPTECAIDLYVLPYPPAVEAAIIRVLEVPVREPIQEPYRRADEIGYLSGLAAWHDLIAVIAHEDYRATSAACDERSPDRLIFIEPASGETVGSSSIAGCAAEIFRLADGGAIVVHGGTTPALSRLDRTGRTERFATIDDPRIAGWFIRGVAELQSEGLLAVLFGRFARGSAVLTFDPQTLQPARPSWTWGPTGGDGLLNDAMFTLTAVEERRQLLVTVDAGDRLLTLDPNLPGVVTATQAIFPNNALLGSGDFRQVEFIPGSRDLLVASQAEVRGLFRRGTEIAPRVSPMIFFEQDLEPTAFGILDPRLAMSAFVTRSAPLEAWIALVDVERSAIVPGALSLGRGVVREMVVDKNGAVWASLPSSASLARLRTLR